MANIRKKTTSFHHEENGLALLMQANKNSFDNYLHTVLNSTREAIFLLDTTGKIKVFNKYARQLIRQFTGSDINTVKNLVDAVPDFRKDDVKKHIAEAARGEIKEYEVRYSSGDWLQVSFFPVYNYENIIQEICCTLKDITTSKKSEEALQYEAALLNNVKDAIIATEIDFTITSLNKAAEEMYGLKANDAIGKNLNDLIQFNFQSGNNKEEELKVLQTQNHWRGMMSFIRNDRKKIFIEANVSYVLDGAGKKIGMVAVTRDITEVIKNKEELNLLSKVVKE